MRSSEQAASARRRLPQGAARNGGFTLLELVLVMVIIGTVLGAAAPSLRGFFTSRKADDTATRIVSLTRLARSEAVAEGRVHRLQFGARLRTYSVTAQHEGSFRPTASGLGRPIEVPEEVELELEVAGAPAGRNYIEFFPDGRTEQATIRLTDIKGGALEVSCAAPTEFFTVRSVQEQQ